LKLSECAEDLVDHIKGVGGLLDKISDRVGHDKGKGSGLVRWVREARNKASEAAEEASAAAHAAAETSKKAGKATAQAESTMSTLGRYLKSLRDVETDRSDDKGDGKESTS